LTTQSGHFLSSNNRRPRSKDLASVLVAGVGAERIEICLSCARNAVTERIYMSTNDAERRDPHSYELAH
jgi:hypothetical protein